MTESEEEEKFNFGITQLDERYLDGIPQGSTIAVIGPTQGPATQYLGQVSGLRETTYITTEKPTEVVEKEAKITSSRFTEDKHIPDTLNVKELHNQDTNSKSHIESHLSDMNEKQNFIIDNFTSISENIETKETYHSLVREIYKEITKNKGVSFLYFIGENYNDLTKKEKEAINILDGVLLFETDMIGQSIQTDLMIYKLRGIGEVDRTTFRLKTGNKIQIDSSQEIA